MQDQYYEDKEERKDWEVDDDDASEDEGEMLFQVSEAGKPFLGAIFGKQMHGSIYAQETSAKVREARF